MAAIWKLPSSSSARTTSTACRSRPSSRSRSRTSAERAAGYGIPGVTVDGNDVAAVDEAVTRRSPAPAPATGPTLIESVTYRWKGHSKTDQNLYRTKEEIDEWREPRPDPALRGRLVARARRARRGRRRTRSARRRLEDDARRGHARANAAPDADPADLLTPSTPTA